MYNRAPRQLAPPAHPERPAPGAYDHAKPANNSELLMVWLGLIVVLFVANLFVLIITQPHRLLLLAVLHLVKLYSTQLR